jgi:chorismate mutase
MLAVTPLSLADGAAGASAGLATAPLCRKEDARRARACAGVATGDGQVSDDVLKAYRTSIDNIDAALIFMLAERFKITQAVGRHKAATGLPAADPAREAQQIARLRQLAESASLDPEFSEKFLRFIIDEVIRHHQAAQQ